jgi:hypothetical protein
MIMMTVYINEAEETMLVVLVEFAPDINCKGTSVRIMEII